MADHNLRVIVFTAFLLSCVYTRTAGTFLQCEDETLRKEVTWSKIGIAHASFCLEINPPPHHFAEIPGKNDSYCFVHHLCAGRYYWWWEASDTDQDIYTIHVQIRDVRAQGGGEFPITIFTDRYSDSLNLTVVVSEKGDSQSNYVPFLPHVKQNVPECAAAEARPISKSGASCPNGWLPVGNGLCVMDEVGPPLNYPSATESCADFGATLVKLKKDSVEERRRRQATNENDDDDNGDMEGDEDDYADEDDEGWDDESEEENNANEKDDNFEGEEGEEDPSDDVQREDNDDEDDMTDEDDDEYSDNDVDDEEDQEGETNEDDYEDDSNADSDSPSSLKKQEEEQNNDSDNGQDSDEEKDDEEKEAENKDETLNDDRNEDDEQDGDYDDEDENDDPREGEGDEEKSKEDDKDTKEEGTEEEEEESDKDNEDKIQGSSNNKEDVKNISRDEDGDDSEAINEDKDEESKGVENNEDDENVGKVEEDFKSLTLKDHYTLDTCLNARLMVIAGEQNLWVLNEDNELSCMSYNSVTRMLQEENSCKYLYNRYACLFDANKYKKPKITNFSVKFHFSNTNHKNVSLSVKSGGTIYHDVTEDVDSVTVSCEAEGWPVPEVLILEDSGVGKTPAFHSSPHHQNISGGQDSLLGRFTCIAGNIFGDEVKINDLQLWRRRQMSRTKMIVSGVLVLVIFFLVVAMCIVVNRGKVRMCKNYKFCRYFVCPWNCCSFSRKRPAGSTRLANDIFPPSSDYVYGDVWADEVPLYVRQTRARKSPETGNIYRAIKEQEQEQQA